jgi:hypothetical protein
VDYAKPDSRYTRLFSLGFSLPRADFRDLREYKNKYGCSRGVTRNETLVLSVNKAVSLGVVRSYGSITTVVNSAGTGAQGSPCFNELGKCWGFLVNAHPDIPECWANKVGRSVDEDALMRDIDRKIARADRGGRSFSRRDGRGRPFGGIKKDKKKKKKKHKKKRGGVLSDTEEREAERRRRKREAESKLPPPISDEYFDIKSMHQLIPILPFNNSYNRNMAITFSHSGVRFILERLAAFQNEYGQL